jgi:hypothetical protein
MRRAKRRGFGQVIEIVNIYSGELLIAKIYPMYKGE